MANVTSFERTEAHSIWTKAGPITSRLPDDQISALEDQSAATMADPSVLGLWGFATGTWIVGTVFGGAFPAATLPAIVPALLVFAGVAQFVAGLFAYRRVDSLAATAFCCFGAFSVALAFTVLMQTRAMIPSGGNAGVLLGFFIESFAFIALALTIASLRRNFMLGLTLGLLTIGYLLSGIPDLADVTTGGWATLGNIGGWFLVVSAIAAYYLGFALIVNSTWKRNVLPIGGEA